MINLLIFLQDTKIIGDIREFHRQLETYPNPLRFKESLKTPMDGQ